MFLVCFLFSLRQCFKQEHSTNSRNSLEKNQNVTKAWHGFNSTQWIFPEDQPLSTRELVITPGNHNQHPRLPEFLFSALAIPTYVNCIHYLVSEPKIKDWNIQKCEKTTTELPSLKTQRKKIRYNLFFNALCILDIWDITRLHWTRLFYF